MHQDAQIFIATVVAVFLGAAPFLLLGALLSSVFEIYMEQDFLERHLPKGRIPGLLFGVSAGMLVPTCECGVVSIVRRLLKRKVPSHVAIAYLFSAPVINPLVLVATYVAFRGNIQMVAARVLVVAVCACCMGWAAAGIDPSDLLREGKDPPAPCATNHCGHDHNHQVHASPHFLPVLPEGGDIRGCGFDGTAGIAAVLTHTASEFLDMGKYLVLGSMAVGFFKLLLVENFLPPFQNNVFFAVGAMMFLAVFLSICSEADAFVAASFSGFPAAAQLSFMTLGPMVDLKLIFMYGSVFRRRITLLLIFLPTVLIFVLSLLVGSAIR
jgi:uncharacterized membrane protein YraQ (UPF0718 family)